MSSSFNVQGLLRSLRPSTYTILYLFAFYMSLSRVVDVASRVCIEEIPPALCFATVLKCIRGLCVYC